MKIARNRCFMTLTSEHLFSHEISTQSLFVIVVINVLVYLLQF